MNGEHLNFFGKKLKISERHLAKTISWRLIGTIDTLILSWLITGDINIGLQISGFEFLTKMALYYAHERLWFSSRLINKRKRHLSKTLTWRLIGTLDTIILGWIFTGNPLSGMKIGGAEIISKLILYYLHEKTWYQLNYGLSIRLKRKKTNSNLKT
tara:strand:- start:328 stop:795 length:468 start_codon:yes stop_codon:yes gene_type:complete